MRTILLYSLLMLTLTGCFSGIGPSGLARNGCIGECSAKDFYQPGKGVWADDTPIDKSTIGAGLGTVIGVVATHSSGDPLSWSGRAHGSGAPHKRRPYQLGKSPRVGPCRSRRSPTRRVSGSGQGWSSSAPPGVC